MAVDSTLPSKKFLKLIIDKGAKRLDASHIFQLRSGRISQNIFMDRFKRRKVPSMRSPEGKRAALQIRLPGVPSREPVTAHTTQGEGIQARGHLKQQRVSGPTREPYTDYQKIQTGEGKGLEIDGPEALSGAAHRNLATSTSPTYRRAQQPAHSRNERQGREALICNPGNHGGHPYRGSYKMWSRCVLATT